MEAAAAGPSVPETLADATRHQPRARATLAAALASPGHAYIFRGPPGSGKAAAARAFAAELLAMDAPDPEDARRRALLDPSPHPDLVWLRPPGGDVELARLLLGERGGALRAIAEAAARFGRAEGGGGAAPWRDMLEAASEAGEEAGAAEESRLIEEAEATARRGRKGKLTREAI